MLPSTLLTRTVVHKRYSNTLFAGVTFPFTQSGLSWASSPEPAHLVLMLPSGGFAGLTVEVTGTLNGAPQTDIMTTTVGSGLLRGEVLWNAVTVVRSVSISGLTLSASMIYPSGHPAGTLQTITASVKMRIDPHRFPLLVENTQGAAVKQRFRAYANPFSAIPGDILDQGSDRYQVEAVDRMDDGVGIHHYQLELQKIN